MEKLIEKVEGRLEKVEGRLERMEDRLERMGGWMAELGTGGNTHTKEKEDEPVSCLHVLNLVLVHAQLQYVNAVYGECFKHYICINGLCKSIHYIECSKNFYFTSSTGCTICRVACAHPICVCIGVCISNVYERGIGYITYIQI